MTVVADLAQWFATPAGGRLAIFLGAFAALAALESAFSSRPHQRAGRWSANLGLGAAGALVGRLVPGAGALAAAAWAQQHNIGLLNLAGLHGVLGALLAIAALDAIIYWQHRLFHRINWLWRMHKVHHADDALDVSTALRFHPLEILVSLGVKTAAAIALGVSPAVVLIFEALLNASAMFNHANLRLHPRLDAALRWIIITPAMHRVHHSADQTEMNHNYGFFLSWWDKLFGSYRRNPSVDVIGLPNAPFGDARGFWRALIAPFTIAHSDYPLRHTQTHKEPIS